MLSLGSLARADLQKRVCSAFSASSPAPLGCTVPHSRHTRKPLRGVSRLAKRVGRPRSSTRPKFISRKVALAMYSKPNGASGLLMAIGGLDGARLEIHHQMAGVEQGFAVVLVVQDAAAAVRRVCVNQTQRQHVAALAFVAPHRVAAAWAQGVGVAGFLHVFAVRAAGAQAPRFHRRNTGVHAADANVPATGVELVLRRQFAERGLRRAFVFVQGLPFVALFLPRLSVDDRTQRHALLREGVVGNQPFRR